MTRRTAMVSLGALAVTTAVAGCMGQNPNTPKGAPAKIVEVRETEMKIDPKNVTIDKPGVVEFRVQNAGQVVHALEIEGPTGEVETDQIPTGKSATLTANLNRPGKYKWYCPVGDHEAQGMTGTVTVRGS
jgi:PQQ system protein